MNKENKLAIGLLVLILIFAFLWYRRRAPLQAAANALGVVDPFAAPYYWTTPGVPDLTQVVNGANQPFVSVINVNANIDAYSGLNNNYIPMFGMVGVTGSGL